MMRSMYSGVAGLKTHQTKMDVIGNNIANVNTVAYKSQSVTFNEIFYQTTSTASGPNAATGTGGVNPKQVGLGVKTGAISTAITTSGSAETTNKPFDMSITGESFFVVSDGNNTYFTRDGSFMVDAAGNLVMSATGYNVMGWQVDPNTGNIKQDTVSALRIMSAANMTYPPEATTAAYISGIIDRNSTEVNSPDGKIMNLNFYDNLGYKYTAKLTVKTVTDGQYTCELVALLDENGNDVTEKTGAKLGTTIPIDYETVQNKNLANGYSIALDGDSYVISNAETPPKNVKVSAAGITSDTILKTNEDGTPAPYDVNSDELWDFAAKAFGYTDAEEFKHLRADTWPAGTAAADKTEDTATEVVLGENLFTALQSGFDSANQTVTVPVVGYNLEAAVTLEYSTTDGSFIGVNGTQSGITQLTFEGPEATNFKTITVDFSASSNVNNEGTSTISAYNGDQEGYNAGRKLGNMTGVSVQNNGMIYATYDNGQSKLLGQIAGAAFANASGLSKEGDNLYAATQNSGEFDGIGVDFTSDGGYITTGVLEMSNVDLSAEFTSMITTQRGFQANSRVITVSDTMLEELTNLKR